MLDESGRYAFADGPAERSLSWVLSAIDAHVVPEEASGALVTQLFASGKADAAISGPWLAADLTSSVAPATDADLRSEEHTSELHSPDHPLCPLLLQKNQTPPTHTDPP